MARVPVHARTLLLATGLAPLLGVAFHLPGATAAAKPRCLGKTATLVVTARSPHVVNGTSRADVIVIQAPGHVVTAGAGNDLICGSGGNDTINGDAGNDTLQGDDGNDQVTGGPGDDVENGGAGNDDITFEPGDFVTPDPADADTPETGTDGNSPGSDPNGGDDSAGGGPGS